MEIKDSGVSHFSLGPRTRDAVCRHRFGSIIGDVWDLVHLSRDGAMLERSRQ